MELTEFLQGYEAGTLENASLLTLLKDHIHLAYSDDVDCDFCSEAVEAIGDCNSVPEGIWLYADANHITDGMAETIAQGFAQLDTYDVASDTWLFHVCLSSESCPRPVVDAFLYRSCEMLSPVSFMGYVTDETEELVWSYGVWMERLANSGTQEDLLKFSQSFHDDFNGCSGEWGSCSRCQEIFKKVS